MNKGLLRAAFMVVILMPGLAAALGMGEIEGHSYLNQPLDARIPLKSYSSSDIKNLSVGLASEAEFARAGVDYTPVLKQLKFKVMRDPKTGAYYIRVYTQEAIRDAYLNFLIEVNWPEGRLIREYTLLLDPPDVTTSTAPGITAPAQEVPQAAPQPQSRQQQKPVTTQGNQPIVYGPVRINETLWDIAERIRGNRRDVSIEQIIMALLRNNPNAFINNNVNNLKAGVILRIDNPDDIRAISKSQAQQEFRRQYQQWLDYKRRRAARPQAEKQGYGEETGQQQATQGSGAAQTGGGTLKLAPPQDEDKRLGQTGEAGTDKATKERIAQLQKQLDDAKTEAASGKQENEALRERLKALEDQLASLQRVVTVKSDELANLQQQLQQEQADLDSKMAAEAETGQEPTTASETGEEEATTPIEAPATQPEVQEQGPGLMAKLALGVQSWYRNPMQTGITAGLSVLLLVLLLLYARQRRRSRDNVIYSSKLEQNARYQDDIFDTEHMDSWARDEAFEDEMEAGLPEDPMAQADIYIAFGKFDEAVELMEQAIEAEPDNLALKVKLDDILNLKAKPRMVGVGEAEEPAAAEEEPFESAFMAEEPMAEPEPEASDVSDFEALFEETSEPEAEAMPGMAPEAEPEHRVEPEAFNEHDVELVPIEDNEDEFSGFPNYGSDYTKPYDGGLISEDEISSFHKELGGEPSPTGISLDDDDALGKGLGQPLAEEPSQGEGDLDFNIDELSFESEQAPATTPAAETSTADSLDFDLGDLEGLSEAETAAEEPSIELGGDEGGLDFDLGDLEALTETEQPAEEIGGEATLEFDSDTLDSLLETDEDLTLTSTADEADELSWESALEAPVEEGESEISDDEFAQLQDMVGDEATEELAEEEVDIESGLDSGMDLDAGFDLDSELNTALDELEQEIEMPDIDLSSDEDVDLLNTVDEVGTKLDLAQAYMDMGDPDGARSILEEVLVEGNDKQKQEAEGLLEQLTEMA